MITVEFLIDEGTKNVADYLPESVVLLTENNKELRRKEPKKSYVINAGSDALKFEWDLAGIGNGTYFVHIDYGAG